ncbi:spore cortex biosynthesis protein YabQ [Marinicrinis lubricantis]|uniref:Spore cortex biosynthesis protein YabQ n=1 Tax=Marinicrinis lubricantis TaxID=2086470 RepID=A0ABW1IPN2_9BACL
MSLHTQLATLLTMLISGQVLGAVFDMYRVISVQLHFRRWLIPILDLCYWIAATLFVFRMLYVSNHGEVRIYVFIALIIGVWAYYGLLSDTVIKYTKVWIRLVRRLIQLLIRTFEWVVIRPIRMLYRLCVIIFGIMTTVAVFIGKIVLQLLYPIWKILKWMASPLTRIGWLRKTWDWLADQFQSIRSWLKR